MSSKIITYILVVLILAALSLAILANSMAKPLGHDEQMYCTGAVLLANGKIIYKDFSYVAQMPYHPLLCAALFKMFNTTHYLLTGRILSVVCDIFVVVCIVGIYRRVFDSFPITGLLLGLAAAVLCVFNPLVDYANGFAWNHDIVILCVLLAFWIFQTTDFKHKSKYRRIAAIAALLTLATCMRLTTVLVQLLFFVVLLARPADSAKQRFKTISPFLIATACLLIWPIWTLISAPRAFFLNLFRIPVLNSNWLHKIGMVHNKFDLTFSSLTTPGYLVLIVIGIYLYLTVTWQHRKLTISNIANLLLVILLPVTFFIIAFIPPTMWRQYLAMPVPFIIISFAYPLLYLRKLTPNVKRHSERSEESQKYLAPSFTGGFLIACTVVVACVIIAVASLPVVFYRVPKLFNPQDWTPIRLHRISEDIAGKLKTQNSKLILTLAPLYALEGGCDIYPQLSAGPFVYRIADYLSPSDRNITNTVGPKTIEALLEKSAPSAVILGTEPEFLEAHLFQTAVLPEGEKWERKTYDNGPVVYFRR